MSRPDWRCGKCDGGDFPEHGRRCSLREPTPGRHFVGMFGSRGCLPDYLTGPCESATGAAVSLAGIHEFTPALLHELIREQYLSMPPGSGAEYCEIIACDCGEPDCHAEP